jgi:hypothetical protein
MFTGHGKLNAYHRFKITEHLPAPVGEEAKQHTNCFMVANCTVRKERR